MEDNLKLIFVTITFVCLVNVIFFIVGFYFYRKIMQLISSLEEYQVEVLYNRVLDLEYLADKCKNTSDLAIRRVDGIQKRIDTHFGKKVELVRKSERE